MIKSDGTTPLLAEESPITREVRSSSSHDDNGRSPILNKIFSGGSLFDAFMMEAAQLIGQALLSLPWIFSLMGYASSIFFIIFFSLFSIWTNCLAISMLTQFRHQIQLSGDPRSRDPHYVASYYDVIGHFCGRGWGTFTFVVVVLALAGLAVAQILGAASSLYLVTDYFSKRALTLIVGGVFALIVLLPSAREYRAFSALAVVATLYSAVYFTFASVMQGPAEDVVYNDSLDTYQYFQGYVATIFIFGGLSATIEKADVMNDRSQYSFAYVFAVLYSYAVIIPVGLSAYHTFGAKCLNHQNAFTLFEPSAARTVGIILMTLHEFVAFGLFMGPLFHSLEKAAHIHDRPLLSWRIIYRLLVVGCFIFLCVMMPFYGDINSVFAAFTTTFATFIIPCICFNITFSSSTQPDDLQRPPPKCITNLLSFRSLRWINWFLAAFIFICGVGFGGYSSIRQLIKDAGSFSLFPKCYQCN